MANATMELLLIEDDDASAAAMRQSLGSVTGVSYEITRRKRLKMAVELLREERFDVALVDLGLPDGRGLESLLWLRRAAPDLPVVVLSSETSEELAMEAVRSGAQDYLVKDTCSPDLLHRSIHYSIERKRSEERLRDLSRVDALTGLANRPRLWNRLDIALARSRRNDTLTAVLLLDLDQFKVINDSLGHTTGDHLLIELASRLRNCLRATDTVARQGGDEFILLLEELKDEREAARVATKLLDMIREPFFVDGYEIHTSTSIGVAVAAPDDPEIDPDSLIKQADAAMYQAKEGGRSQFRFYTKEMHARISFRLGLETSLRRAIEREELVLHYQPQVELNGGEVSGFEALVRWDRPGAQRLVAPDVFIPVAEESHLIFPLQDWVLRRACHYAASLQLVSANPVRMAVTLSPQQLRNETLVHQVRRALDESGLDPELLELEITEGALIEDRDVSRKVLEQLQDMGCRIALDDFGTGYSCLAYLRDLPIDVLKIDKTFTFGLLDDPYCAAIAETVMTLGQKLGMEVLAEGVETQEHYDRLQEQGCTAVQGWFTGRPMAEEQVPGWLARVQRRGVLAAGA